MSTSFGSFNELEDSPSQDTLAVLILKKLTKLIKSGFYIQQAILFALSTYFLIKQGPQVEVFAFYILCLLFGFLAKESE